MDETGMVEMRNYCMAGGYFVITFSSFMIFQLLFRMESTLCLGYLHLFAAVLLLIFGITLLCLKCRDLTAITFLLIGWFYSLFGAACVVQPGYGSLSVLSLVCGVFFLLLTVLILTATDRKKYLLALIPALQALVFFTPFDQYGSPTFLKAFVVMLLGWTALYLCFAAASERIRLPGSKTLTADIPTNFKDWGAVFGFFVFAVAAAGFALSYISTLIPECTLESLELVCGLYMILAGILLVVIGKMRFMPIFFILLGFIELLGTQVSGAGEVILGMMTIVVGLFAILRNESRLLMGIMAIFFGLTYLFSGFPVWMGILNLIPCLIALYLAFAVFNEKKILPLF